MTPIELIEDTIEYYKNNPRGTSSEGNCEYKSANGNMCAIGRWLDWDRIKEDGIDEVAVNQLGSIDNGPETEEFIFKYLKPEVAKIPLNLWIQLQSYHDCTLSEDESLSKSTTVDKLRNTWKN